MVSRLNRISSLKRFPLSPYDSDIDDPHLQEASITDDKCIEYCINFAPKFLGLQDNNNNDINVVNGNKYDFLKVERIIGGITNSLYKVTNTINNKSVLVRIFGSHSSMVVNRKRGLHICDLLSKFNISKNIYCYFNDGQIEEWIEGRNLTEEDLYNSKYMIKIAQNLKKLHSIKIEGKLIDLINIGDEPFGSSLWTTTWRYYELVKKYMQNKGKTFPNIDYNDLEKKIRIIEKFCNKVNSPLVLCHCDLLSGNIILLPNEDVRFIDFEYCCCMERGFDIANHFNEYTGFSLNYDLFPTDDMQRQFLREYLKFDIKEWRPSLEGLSQDLEVSTSEDSVDKLMIEIQPFFLASHVFWGVWGILQSIFSTIDFDFSEYAQKRIELFLNHSFWDNLPDLN